MDHLLSTMDQVSSNTDANLRRIRGGQALVDAPPGEKLVISGISGYFPNSHNVQEFKQNLLNKVDLCDDDERRWVHNDDEIPRVSGKIYKVDKFDSGFFGIPELQAHWMDPFCRLLLERSLEAIMDAGINPEELKGTRTGVFIGASQSESEMYNDTNKISKSYLIIGCMRSMIANRISYMLQLNGPSFCCDTACSSGIYAFDSAYRSVREGKCDMAIVAGVNLCLDRNITLQFARLGVLNKNTGCRPFDRDATGYTRSEAAVAMFLQKEKDSRRIYARIIHSKLNIDGFKEEGITYPSGADQQKLLMDVYEECREDPTKIAYLEAHGTGTKVGDPEELSAIDKVFCSKERKIPLLIGSVKGNIGHTEPVSGLCSLIKVLLGMHFDYIPPNIHYDNPRPDIPVLMEKRVTVVTEKTKWPRHSNLAGINCFGFGGANGHIVLEKYNKKNQIQHDDIPRLICMSGRTKHAIETIQNYLRDNELDYEFVRLIQAVFSKTIHNHLYRGYSILLPNKEIKRSACTYKRNNHTLYLCLGNENVHSCDLLKELQKLLPFKETYERCIRVLKKNDIKIQLNDDEPSNILQKVLTTVITHLGIIDIFRSLNIKFDYIRGLSMGDFTAGYANGMLTLDEAIMATYTISKHLRDSTKPDGKDFQKLLTKLQSIIEQKNVKVNGAQISKSNKYPYGSTEYFLFNILNPALVAETYPPFASNSIVVNVDYKYYLNDTIINLDVLNADSKMDHFLNCMGRLYELGYDLSIEKLFPEIKWPLSPGSAMFSPLLEWNNSKSFYVTKELLKADNIRNEKIATISVMGSNTFYKGHVIDGRTLFPATGYVVLVWKLFATISMAQEDNMRVCFENIKFLRATNFSKDDLSFVVIINKEGFFEIVEGNAPVASGRIRIAEKFNDLPKPDKAAEDEIPLSQKDIYKELRLRGYQYKGAFKAVQEIHGNEGKITWGSNWIAFLDNMLQLQISKVNSRALAVPIGIDRLLLDTTAFLNFVDTLDDEKKVSCYINKSINTIYTTGIQISGLRASTISRKRQMYQPILETYKFVPNHLTTSINNSMRINMQIVLEMKSVINVKILEVVNEQSDNLQPLSMEIVKVLEDMPLIQPSITVFSKHELDVDMKGIHLEKDKISYDHSNLIYIGSNLMQDEKCMQVAMTTIDEQGFIITIESREYPTTNSSLNILTRHQINNKFIYLLRKSKPQINPLTINVSTIEKMDSWLDAAKTNCKNSKPVILYAQNNNLSGILGFTNCIRREPNGESVSCFFIRDKAPPFDKNDNFYKNQIDKGMGINVYQDGQWGTYRHIICNPNAKVKSKHFYGSTGVRGDLSSFDWFQGSLTTKYDNITHIYYSALNFRDVMLASGKLPVESITTNRIEQECVEGFEFSGRDKTGKRVMGITQCGANSNLVQSSFTWNVPSRWSLEEAATVPVVYLTVLKSFSQANIKHGQSVLIHSGTGGIGQAALNVCRYYNCNVFTTVGTEEKRKYLLNNYPELKPSHIGNSRNTSFEEMVFRETNGRGVDIILNSLSEDKLHASVRCLAKGGYFMEIGKYDLSNDTRINADLLNKACTYQGIMLEVTHYDEPLFTLFSNMLEKTCIKPLNRTVFEIDQLENAFRYMTTGKHMGKVLIKIRDEEKEAIVPPTEITHYAVPKFYCDPELSYIILGGLGGFGLELADWLMLRGAKTLVLSSRNGVVTGYQQSRIRNWKENGVNTVVLMDDIMTYEGCRSLLTKSNSIAPVGGIFNLAVELRDALLENLTYLDFLASLRPKALATTYLDKLSRELCPKLHQFVTFSSVSCGRGNAGQSNYGMSNSVMERICEQRHADGLPAIAIQWGAVGDVGLVAEMQKDATEIAIGGTLQQRISSCLYVMDKFLKQNAPVVSSIVVAEKFGSNNADNLVDTVLAMLGVSNIKSISLHATLAELGMDSMMAIEMRQTLEREYDVFLSANDMRTLTFAKLIEINESRENSLISTKDDNFDISELLIRHKFDESNYLETTVEVTANKDTSKHILFIPGIEGTYVNLENIMKGIKYSSTCLQFTTHGSQESFKDIVNFYYPIVKDVVKRNKTFNIVAHSFGGVFALEMVSMLEKEGYIGKLVLIDSSAEYISKLLSMFSGKFDDEFEAKLILKLLDSYLPPHRLPEVAEKLLNAKTTEERKQIGISTIPDDSTPLNKYLYVSGQNTFALMIAFIKYKFSTENKLKSKIMLCKPTLAPIRDIPEDYYLSNHVEDLEIETIEGGHLTMLENVKIIESITTFIES